MSVSKRECLERIRDLSIRVREQQAEIERLRREHDKCRRLLREAATIFSRGTDHDAEWSEWLNTAAKAGGDDE
jgi:hypothetical protein